MKLLHWLLYIHSWLSPFCPNTHFERCLHRPVFNSK